MISLNRCLALKKTGLDICGVDCAPDSEGNIVIFEANAAMQIAPHVREGMDFQRTHGEGNAERSVQLIADRAGKRPHLTRAAPSSLDYLSGHA